MSNKDVKLNMHEHSKVKVELYGSYLAKYLNIIANDRYTKKIFIYDLFCGPGIYENGGKGSPLIALETIQQNFGANPYFCPKMKLHFNDKDNEKLGKLQDNIKSLTYPDNCEVQFSSEDYSLVLQNVINEIENYGNEKGIVFIDPYGYKEIKLENIKNLLASKKIEVLLFLPSQFMFRFANSTTDDTTGGRESLHKFIKEVFGDNIPEFKNSIDFIEQLKNGFKNYLRDYYVAMRQMRHEITRVKSMEVFENQNKVECGCLFCDTERHETTS